MGYRRLKFQAFKLAKVSLREALQDKDFYDPISVGIDFPEHHGYHCNFICKVNLECQLPIQFCLPNLWGSHGNIYFMWHEDQTSDINLTEHNNVIENVTKMLPKYFSRVHKNKMHLRMENVMLDKISPAQFRFIYQEITGDTTVKNLLRSKQRTTSKFAVLLKLLMLHYLRICV